MTRASNPQTTVDDRPAFEPEFKLARFIELVSIVALFASPFGLGIGLELRLSLSVAALVGLGLGLTMVAAGEGRYLKILGAIAAVLCTLSLTWPPSAVLATLVLNAGIATKAALVRRALQRNQEGLDDCQTAKDQALLALVLGTIGAFMSILASLFLIWLYVSLPI